MIRCTILRKTLVSLGLTWAGLPFVAHPPCQTMLFLRCERRPTLWGESAATNIAVGRSQVWPKTNGVGRPLGRVRAGGQAHAIHYRSSSSYNLTLASTFLLLCAPRRGGYHHPRVGAGTAWLQLLPVHDGLTRGQGELQPQAQAPPLHSYRYSPFTMVEPNYFPMLSGTCPEAS
jgi:hypothetical protein